jgi:hypothetical protein
VSPGATRLHGPAWLSGALHLFILAGAAHSERPEAWPWALFAMAAVSFFAWMANYRRYRQIHDLPTSRIASAAQGYVELFGRCESLPASALASPLSATACCWHAWRIRRRNSRDQWETVDSGRSVAPFQLIDDTGHCLVMPEGAEVLSGHTKTWREGEREYTEWLLLPYTPLYAIGAFATTGADTVTAREEHQAMADLLAEWKSSPALLHARFDLDSDGQLDLREWELARLEARRELRRRRAEAPAARDLHTLQRPRDGRLFLLANELPERIGLRYRWWTWGHLALFLVLGGAGLWLLHLPGGGTAMP